MAGADVRARLEVTGRPQGAQMKTYMGAIIPALALLVLILLVLIWNATAPGPCDRGWSPEYLPDGTFSGVCYKDLPTD
jgi:hypothetical protein